MGFSRFTHSCSRPVYIHWCPVAVTWRWPNFSIDELKCKGTGEYPDLTPEIETFLDKLQAIRDVAGPMVITSGYRSPSYNARVSKTGTTGPHTTGRAVDVAVRGIEAFQVVQQAFEKGMTGIGINQKGKARFIHLDDLTDGPRPRIWSY